MIYGFCTDTITKKNHLKLQSWLLLSIIDIICIKCTASNAFSCMRMQLLGFSFSSFTSKMFKINSTKKLLYRAYHLSFSYSKLSELNFQKTFFKNNGYLLHIIETQINKFLNSMFSSTKTVINEITSFPITHQSPKS